MGCAIECRMNAEDYRNEFRPSPGRVRVIASGEDRAMAIARLREAIAATRISGVKTNLGFHGAALDDPEFQTGGVDTGFVDRLYARRPDLCDRQEAGASYG